MRILANIAISCTFFLLFTLDAACQTITSISPVSGSAGTTAVITGSGFGSTQGGGTVMFGPRSATIGSWSDSSITVVVPSRAATGNVVIKTGGGVTSNGVGFTVIPAISDLSPNAGAVGSLITISGSSFGGSTGSVSFNGLSARFIASWNPSSIVASIPNGATSGSITITSSGGTTSNAVALTVVPAPLITSVSPAAGSAGTSVVISGTNFGALQGWGSVTFHGVFANVNNWSDTSISAIVPSGATTGNVVVTASGGVQSSGYNFATAGALNTNRYLHSAVLLNNGKVLVAGGVSCSAPGVCSYLNTGEIYDPVSGAFTSTGSMSAARSAPAVLLANGKVLIAGGYACNSSGTCASLSSAEIYDPVAGAFTSAGNLNVDRYGHTMTVMNNGQVFIAGGQSCTSATSCMALDSVEVYDPIAGTFMQIGTLAQARFGAAATLLADGKVLIVGGFDGTGFPAAGEIYIPAFGFFTTTSGSLVTPRYQPSATLLNNGKVLIAGGSTCISPGCPVNAAELYDESHDTFTAVANMNGAHTNHAATLLNNGQVIIAGGYSSCSSSCTAGANIEVYDGVANTFTPGTGLISARAGHTATLLQNGNIVFAGGINQGLTLDTSESYQPANFMPAGLASIAITPVNRSFLPGVTLQLTATGTFSGGSTQTLQSVTWTSSDNTIATVTTDASNHGLAYAVASGSVTVSACAGPVCGTTTLRVGLPALTSMTIAPASAAIVAGTPQRFSVTGLFSDGTSQDVTSTATWNSSAPQIATVNSIGVANGLVAGNTTIQAGIGPIISLGALTVRPPAIVSLVVQPSLGGTTVGGTEQFTAIGIYTDGSTQDITTSVTWSSSSTGLATINAAGLSTGISGGNATIKALLGGATATGSLTVAAPGTPPAITASASPAASANGWNNTNVTITFTCRAGSAAVVSCPGSQIVSSEGANQVISGTVTDANGGTASTSVTLSIDKSAPTITLSSPAEGASFTNTSIQVTGSIADSLSGVSTASCDGVAVPVSGGAFSCSITLNPGMNLIRVQAGDLAGNSSALSIHAKLTTSLPAPASLTITPGTVNMVVDEIRSFVAVDELGRSRPDAMWSVSDNTIVTLAADGSGTLTGVAAGQVTLTATAGAISAQTAVNIFGGELLPPGTAVWSVPLAPGQGVQDIEQATPVRGSPDLFSIEGTVIRALTADGRQLWLAQVPSPRFLEEMKPIPDKNGGILLDYPVSRRIIDLDGQTGNQIWEYDLASVDSDRQIAVGPDGTIYFREVKFVPDPVVGGNTAIVWSVTSLDGNTGAPTTLYTVPPSRLNLLDTCQGGELTLPANGSIISNLSIGLDGTVFAKTIVRNDTELFCNGSNGFLPNEVLSLLELQSGSVNVVPIRTLTIADDPDPGADIGFFTDIVPDGQGGAFASWVLLGRNLAEQPHIAHVSGSGAVDLTPPLDAVKMVLGDQDLLFVASLDTIAAIDQQGGGTQWTWTAPQSNSLTLQLVAATDGGGLVAKYNLGSGDILVRFDPSGVPSLDDWDINPDGSAIGFNNFGYWDAGNWYGQSSRAIQELAGQSFALASTTYPFPQGTPQRHSSEDPNVRFKQTTPCTGGFDDNVPVPNNELRESWLLVGLDGTKDAPIQAEKRVLLSAGIDFGQIDLLSSDIRKATVARGAVNGHNMTVTVTGLLASEDAVITAVDHQDHNNVFARLHLAIRPRLTQNVYPFAVSNIDNQRRTNLAPTHIVDSGQLQTRLENTFGMQADVHLTVKNTPPTAISVHYDLNGDGVLQSAGAGTSFTAEGDAVVAGILNFYHCVPADPNNPCSIDANGIFPSYVRALSQDVAVTPVGSGASFQIIQGTHVDSTEMVTTHETGHSLNLHDICHDAGDADATQTCLDNARRAHQTNRLMWHIDGAGDRCLLIKAEWDIINPPPKQ